MCIKYSLTCVIYQALLLLMTAKIGKLIVKNLINIKKSVMKV